MARLSKWNHVGVNHHDFILITAKNRQSPPNTVSHKPAQYERENI